MFLQNITEKICSIFHYKIKEVFDYFKSTTLILTILFEDYTGEWSVDINGNQTDAFNTYNISLTEENEQKTISFMSLNKYAGKELSIEWKDYKILVLEDSEKALKLLVFKNDSKKK